MSQFPATEYLQNHLNGTPNLGIGTSRLAHFFSPQQALQTLDLAFDNGITYYDTAPIYGFGWSEKILGRFAKNKRDQLVLATKAGLDASSTLSRLPLQAQYLLRKGITGLRAIWQPKSHAGSVGIQSTRINGHQLMLSLEHSLKRLNTEYVDFLLLHELTVEQANTPEVIAFAQKAIESGKTRFVGIGSSLDQLVRTAELNPIYSVIQHECELSTYQQPGYTHRIVNIHGVHRLVQKIKVIMGNEPVHDLILNRTGIDTRKNENLQNLCFAIASRQAVNGVVLITSSQKKHLLENVSRWKHNTMTSIQVDQILAILHPFTH